MSRCVRLPVLCALSCLALLSCVVRVSSQQYIPQPPVLSGCPSGSALWSVGSANSTSFTYHAEGSSYVYSNDVYLFNQFTANQSGVTLYQLSLGLLDNSQLTNVAHLRLLVYTYVGNSYAMAASTDEISLWPSSDLTLYGNLLSPLPLVIGVTYAFGVWSDANLYTAYSATYTGGYVYYSAYNPYGPITSFAGCATCTYSMRPLAATGCQSSSDPLSSASNTLYSFCGLLEYWTPTPASSVNYYDPSATTTLIAYQGIAAVGPAAAGTSAQGAYYTVLGAVGEYSRTAVGGYYPMTSNGNTASAFQLGTASNGANQAIYPTAAFGVDGNGLSLLLATGLTVTLQYNATTGRLQTVDSVNGRLTGAYTFFQMQLYTGGSTIKCASTFTNSSSGVAPLTCPSGSTQVQYGDVSSKDLYYYYANDATESYLYGNVLYTRPFTVQTTGTTLYQVSAMALYNPGHIIHIIMGVYAATGVQTSYGYEVTSASMTLLATTAEFELVNGGDGVITLNLLTPLALNASTTYWLGIMADSFFYSGYAYYWYYPAFYTLYNHALPTAWQSLGSVQDVPQISASACVANTQAVALTVCVTFAYATTTTSYQGTVMAIPVAGMDGVYEAFSGSGKVITTTISTGATVNTYNWTLQGLGQSYNQYIYTAASAASVVDSVGLSLVFANPAQTAVMQTVIRYNAASQQYSEWISYYYALTSVTPQVNRGSSVLMAPYTGTPPSCPVFNVPVNTISPAAGKPLICSLPVTYGDPISADYSSHAEGTSISANTLYSVSFAGQAGTVVQQAQLSVLANYANIAAVRIGLYDSTGTLLAQTAEYVLNGLVDQTLYLPLSQPVTLSAASYRLALWSNSTLNMANGASSTSAAALTYSASGLPSSFTPSASGPSLPIAVLGCATATHTMCGWWQYYFPAVGGSAPYAYTVLYSALLFASSTPTATAYGSGYQVFQAGGHFTPYTGGWAGGSPIGQSLPLSINSAGAAQYLYLTGAGVDSAGLTFLASSQTGSRPLTLLVNSSGAVTESSVSGMSALWYNLTVTPYSATSGIPSCGVSALPHKIVGAANTVAACPAGQTAASFGDDNEADLADNTEFIYYSSANYLFLRPFTTGNQSVRISQLAFGINKNPNVVLRLKLGLYDVNNNFLVGSNETVIYNPLDDIVVAPTTAPYTLLPRSQYSIALWVDSNVFNGFTPGGSPAMAVTYSASSWPALFVQSQLNSVRAVQAFGCVVAPSSSIGSSSSTGAAAGGGATTDSAGGGGGGGGSLSNGQVVGIVIGCSIGVALLTALCLLCVLRGLWDGASGGKAGGGYQKDSREADSEVSKMGGTSQQLELSRVQKANMEAEQ